MCYVHFQARVHGASVPSSMSITKMVLLTKIIPHSWAGCLSKDAKQAPVVSLCKGSGRLLDLPAVRQSENHGCGQPQERWHDPGEPRPQPFRLGAAFHPRILWRQVQHLQPCIVPDLSIEAKKDHGHYGAIHLHNTLSCEPDVYGAPATFPASRITMYPSPPFPAKRLC